MSETPQITTLPLAEIEARIGSELGPSQWFTIDQDRINAFADTTLDHQFIHVDPAAAAQTPFGSTIAHGFLNLSMLSHFAEQFSLAIEGIVMALNYGFNKVRFINPVKVGSEIRARAVLASVKEKDPGNFLLQYDISVEIRGEEKPALIAEWLVMQIVPPAK